MKNFYKKGITLMELLIIIFIMGVLVAVVLPQFSRIRENQVLKNGLQDVLSSIDKARSHTLSSLNSSEYGVHFQSDKVIIFKGKVFSDVAPDNETISIIMPANISNVTLNGQSGISGDIYFNRLSGSPSKTGTVTVSTTSYSKTINIFATGVAGVN